MNTASRKASRDRIGQAIRELPDDKLRAMILELRLSTRLEQSALATATREQTRRRRAARRAAQAEAASE